jgi:outer membrane protein OmpA-like peptidoglycan-associated protein
MRKIIISGILVLLSVFIVGCSEDVESVNVGLVVGNRSNSPTPDLQGVRNLVEASVDTSGFLSVITIEGKPRQAFRVEFPERSFGISDNVWERRVNELTQEVFNLTVNQALATSEEADILNAIALAADAVHSREADERHLVVVDSGMSTKGAIDLTQIQLENVDIDSLLEHLVNNVGLPDLTGVYVTWLGLGHASYPQESTEPNSRSRTLLESIWSAVLLESGAKNVDFRRDPPLSLESREDLPKVSVVELHPTIPPPPPPSPPMQVLDEGAAHFLPNKAVLKTNKEDVLYMLEDFILYLESNPEAQILIIGTTASPGSPQNLLELSTQRAQLIQEMLLETDRISQEQIRTIGLGHLNEFTIRDTDINTGELIEEYAAQNRQIIVMLSDSETARRVLEGNQN